MARDVPTDDGMRSATIRIVVHPPERQRLGGPVPAQAGECCCCCCCCCLHSLGSLIGGTVAGSKPVEGQDRSKPVAGPSAVSAFWWATLVLVVATSIIAGLATGGGAGLVIGLLIALLAFPLIQLIAALVAALIVAAGSQPDRRQQLRQVGKIVLGVVIGTLAGGLALAILLFAVCAR